MRRFVEAAHTGLANEAVDQPVHNNRALAGFPAIVTTSVYNPHQENVSVLQESTLISGKHLSDHAKILYQSLLAGKTISKALQDADDAYQTSHSSCTDQNPTPMNMKVHGDLDARLMGVYTAVPGSLSNDQVLPRLPDDSLLWYLILPPVASYSPPVGQTTSSSTPLHTSVTP